MVEWPHPLGVEVARYYRLYFMDRSGGHILQFREFEAEDDAAALQTAERWRSEGSMELWNEDRKLKHWDVALDQ